MWCHRATRESREDGFEDLHRHDEDLSPEDDPSGAQAETADGATTAAGPAKEEPVRQSTLVAGIIRSLRPQQWTKNVLVFAAPVAAGGGYPGIAVHDHRGAVAVADQ